MGSSAKLVLGVVFHYTMFGLVAISVKRTGYVSSFCFRGPYVATEAVNDSKVRIMERNDNNLWKAVLERERKYIIGETYGHLLTSSSFAS
jgi:hypothetical protein